MATTSADAATNGQAPAARRRRLEADARAAELATARRSLTSDEPERDDDGGGVVMERGDGQDSAAAVAPDLLLPGRLVRARADALWTPDYQRKLQQHRVRRMARDLMPRLLGVLLGSEREGRIYIIDGQHRLAAVIMAGHGALRLRVLLIDTLDYREEAELFVLGNSRENTKPLTTGEAFYARLEQNDSRAHAVKETCDAVGVTIDYFMEGTSGKGNTIRAVATLERIFRQGGPEHLTDVLTALTDAYGDQRDSLIHGNLMGFHQFIWRYHSRVDRKRLTSELQAVGLDGLNARAMMAKAAGWRRRTDSGILVGQAIFDIYNGDLPQRQRLPRWEIVPSPTHVTRGEANLYLPRPQLLLS